MEASSSNYACVCLNVRIEVVDVKDGTSRERLADSSSNGGPTSSVAGSTVKTERLSEDVAIPKGRVPTIKIAQLPLTTRVPLDPSISRSQQALTALACLNCNMNVYAVDKPQNHGPPSLLPSTTSATSAAARLVGFATGSPNAADRVGRSDVKSVKSAPPASSSPSPARSAADGEDILRPAPGIGSMWILSGCIQSAKAIADLASSRAFSTSYRLIIASRGRLTTQMSDEDEEDEEDIARRSRASSDVITKRSPRRIGAAQLLASNTAGQRTMSPQRGAPFPATPRRSAASPSPARRRKVFTTAEEEEEKGEDLDALHLLETLLPHLPSSVVHDLPKANGVDSPSVRRHTLSQKTSSSSPSVSSRHLDAKLDHVAIAQLREKRDEAQKEIYEILRQKSAELAQMEKQLRHEARQLRRKALAHASARAEEQQHQHLPHEQLQQDRSSSLSLDGDEEEDENLSPLFLRRRPLVPAMRKSISQDGDPSRRTGQSSLASASIGGSGTPTTQHGTPIPGTHGADHSSSVPATIGSYLSASFAMRGRDLPSGPKQEPQRSEEEEEEWFANKKRLRERYPHADHSALPSAVNSDDEEPVQVKAPEPTDSTDEEEERRGRARARASERGTVNTQKTPTPPKKDVSKAKGARGDQQVTDNQELSQSVPKRGALKGSLNAAEGGGGGVPAAEKKVAFASTTEEVEAAPVPLSEEVQSTVKEEEQGDPVFEIDEDMDVDDATPNSSDITLDGRSAAVQQGGKELAQAEVEEEDEIVDLEDENASTVETHVVGSILIAGTLAAKIHSESPFSFPSDGSENPPFGIQSRSQDAKQAMLAGFPNERLQRSSAIGFRAVVGEAEARLSGILAPHAPSHRDLWSERRRKAESSRKYKLHNPLEKGEEEEAGEEAPSDPLDAKEKRPAWKERGATTGAKASDDLGLARSVPIEAPQAFRGGISFGAQHRQDTSGFDLEPKTSLPYQEKLYTPSLRKATRHLTASHLHQTPTLGAIPEKSDNTGSIGAASVQDIIPGRPPMSRAPSSIADVRAPKASGTVPISVKRTAAASARPEFKYAMPASVTRGFDANLHGAPVLPSPVAEAMMPSPLLGSSAGTGRSSRLRSPRPPYTPPPQPASASLRLQPNEKHRPAALPLAPMTRKDEYEDDEEETDIDSLLQFMHVIEQLKRNKRTGWYHHRVEQPESIADHMYRMGVLSMLLVPSDLDIGKCVQLCLVHDLAEALVGDLTPLDKVDRQEKLQRERDAISHIVHGLLAGSRAGVRIETLWNEYEDRRTPESLAVKDLDRFELALQALEYERRFNIPDLQPFYAGSSGDITTPRIQRWIRRLAKEREVLWKDTQYAYEQTYPVDQVPPPPWQARGDQQPQ